MRHLPQPQARRAWLFLAQVATHFTWRRAPSETFLQVWLSMTTSAFILLGCE